MAKGQSTKITEEEKQQYKFCRRCKTKFYRKTLLPQIWLEKEFCSKKCYQTEKGNRMSKRWYYKHRILKRRVGIFKNPQGTFMKGNKHPAYIGFFIKHGYKYIYLDTRKYRVEHRYVMEQYLEMKLPQEIDVHHIDGNKLNNQIENLCLFTKKEHKLFHWIEKSGFELNYWGGD